MSCCLSYKDTILKANHSPKSGYYEFERAVAYPTKILFWKRITAGRSRWRRRHWLLLILQRYYFESESQQYASIFSSCVCCCLSYKDTILKANHSRCLKRWKRHTAVAYPTKILFWKRITAYADLYIFHLLLLLILQRYYFESESQHSRHRYASTLRCCLSYKDTILKANHSNLMKFSTKASAVAYPTKILFWKRITAWCISTYTYLCCCLSYKDTILKANHSKVA